MSKFFVIEPEVAGRIGSLTVGNVSKGAKGVQTIHYEFEGWEGDDIVCILDIFLITSRFRIALEEIGATGYAIDDAIVTTSEQFEMLNRGGEVDALPPSEGLPKFYWLKITGSRGSDDFGMNSFDLVISQRILNILLAYGLHFGTVEEYCE